MKHSRLFSKTLIILPFALPFEWSADYERQTALALARSEATVIAYLANEGKTVFRWILSPSAAIEKVDGIYLYRPLHILPFHRFRAIRNLNHWIATIWLKNIISHHAKWNRLKIIFWTFSLQRAIFPEWFNKTAFHIYDCVDLFMSGNQKDAPQWTTEERRILRASDAVFTNSSILYNKKQHSHPNVFLLPEGMFIPTLFPPPLQRPPKSSALKHIPHPRVLFIGNINTRLDFRTIRHAAASLPQYSFIFVGNVDTEYTGPDGISLTRELRKLSIQKNIFLLPAVPKSMIASYIRACDVGFIPYDVTQSFNKFCYPMKVQEYFSQGKPIVSSAIEALKPLAPLVYPYTTPRDAVSLLRQALSRPWPKRYALRQRRIAFTNSVDNKLRKAETILLAYFHPEF